MEQNITELLEFLAPRLATVTNNPSSAGFFVSVGAQSSDELCHTIHGAAALTLIQN